MEKKEKATKEDENKLRDKLGLDAGELVETNKGLLDILSVSKTRVTYGFLAGGCPQSEPITDFLNHFPKGYKTK